MQQHRSTLRCRYARRAVGQSNSLINDARPSTVSTVSPVAWRHSPHEKCSVAARSRTGPGLEGVDESIILSSSLPVAITSLSRTPLHPLPPRPRRRRLPLLRGHSSSGRDEEVLTAKILPALSTVRCDVASLAALSPGALVAPAASERAGIRHFIGGEAG